jgi:WD40 repeat protein
MGKCAKTLSEHAYTVSALAWMPDGRSFVSAGMDAKLYFWVRYLGFFRAALTWRAGHGR